MLSKPPKVIEVDDVEPLVLDRDLRTFVEVSNVLYRLALTALVITLLLFGPFIVYSFLYSDEVALGRRGHLFDNSVKDAHLDRHLDEFEKFKESFEKIYETIEEELERFQRFRDSMYKVDKAREIEDDTEFGITIFSDLSDEEFQDLLMPKDYKEIRKSSTFIRPYSEFKKAQKSRRRRTSPAMDSAGPYPDHFDWREKGVVTPVKSQLQCGSCWAFAATATVETSYAIAHGQLRNLSEQELLDCDFSNNACNGGDDDKAFRFIHENGLMLEQDYPYVGARQNSCLLNDYTGTTTKLDVAYFINPDEHAIMEWVVNFGPVNVGINVPPDMKLYKGGVYTPSSWDCKNNILGTHALNIMGYGTWKNGQKYWIVKNSWGQKYGIEDGYVYMARGENSCGIEDEPIGILC